jgi:ribosomal-protein-alanine N-acetyltransferase
MTPAILECRVLCPELRETIARFFQRIAAAGADKFFHPHPFTPEEAARLAHYVGKDVYYALLLDGEMVGYGMLRGWDDGYEEPSVGIAVDPMTHGRGYGRLIMEFLHVAARDRGAKRIRLKVYPNNARAIEIYRSLGYKFQGEEEGQLLGFVQLCN